MYPKITVKVDDLLEMAKEMKKDRMKFVTLMIEPPDTEGDPQPACVSFHASTDLDCPEVVDFGGIDATEELRL